MQESHHQGIDMINQRAPRMGEACEHRRISCIMMHTASLVKEWVNVCHHSDLSWTMPITQNQPTSYHKWTGCTSRQCNLQTQSTREVESKLPHWGQSQGLSHHLTSKSRTLTSLTASLKETQDQTIPRGRVHWEQPCLIQIDLSLLPSQSKC